MSSKDVSHKMSATNIQAENNHGLHVILAVIKCCEDLFEIDLFLSVTSASFEGPGTDDLII
jgi:hypothetical protein